MRAIVVLALAAACLSPAAAKADEVTITQPFVLWYESYDLAVTYLPFGLSNGCASNASDASTPGGRICVTPPAGSTSVQIRFEQTAGGELLAVAGSAGTNYFPGPREEFCAASSNLALRPEVTVNPKLIVTVFGPGNGPRVCGTDAGGPSFGVGVTGRVVMTFRR